MMLLLGRERFSYMLGVVQGFERVWGWSWVQSSSTTGVVGGGGSGGRKQSVAVTLMLAYQSFGVVYGDLSVSPLYVFRSTFSGDLHTHMTTEEIYGVLSLIFWTLTLVPLIKYVIVIFRADDNGEGKMLPTCW